MTLFDELASALSAENQSYPDDAPSSVVASQVHRDLRAEAIANDALADAQVPLALFWQALGSGVCRAVDSFFTDTRCYIVTAGVACHAQPPLEGRRLEILERILSGTVQKIVAFEMELAPSSVASNARMGLRSLGLCGKPSRAHPLLMLAARAARTGDLSVVGSLSVVFPSGVSLRAISIPRPDASLIGLLPPAELAVVRELVEGRSYEEVARRRGTSQRTIANQVATVFRRMQVSGRNELVHRLLAERRVAAPSVASPARPMPTWSPLEMVAS